MNKMLSEKADFAHYATTCELDDTYTLSSILAHSLHYMTNSAFIESMPPMNKAMVSFVVQTRISIKSI